MATVPARTAALIAAQPLPGGGTGPVLLVNGSATSTDPSANAWVTSDDGALYPGSNTYPGYGTYPDGPPLGAPFLSEQLSPYAQLAVEAAFGADPSGDPDDWVWADITGDVRQDAGIKMRHGRNDEASKTQPASMSCVLDNRAGRYSQAPGTLNYPYVRRGTPIRVSVNLGEHLDDAAVPGRPPGLCPGLPLIPPRATYRVLWQGEATGWKPEWDRTGRDATVTLEASGVLRRMGQGSSPAPSMLRRYIPRGGNLVGYWPMEDAEHSSTVAAGIDGISPMSVIGVPTFAKADRIRFSDPVLQVHQATLSAGLKSYGVSGDPAFVVNFVVDMSDDGQYTGADAEIVRIWLSGGTLAYVGVKVRYDSTPVGRPMFFARAVGGAADIVIGNVSFETLIDFPVIVRLRVQQVGADVHARLSTLNPGQIAAGGFTFELAGYSFTHATRVVVRPRGDLNLCGVGHLAVAVNPRGNVSTLALAGYGELDGELAHTRISRICSEEAIPLTLVGTSTSRCGEQGTTPILDVIEEAAEVDQGVLLDGLGPGLTYVCRSARESRDATMTIDVSRGELAKELGVGDDDQGVRNSWEVQRKGGQKATVTDADGPMGTGTIGLYDSSKKINMLSDASAADYAAWLVRLGTVTGYRFPRINLDLAAKPHLASTWVDVLPSSRIDLTNARTVRTQLADDTISLLVEGYTQTISRFRWDVQVNCSPAQPWRVALFAADEGDTDELVGRFSPDGTTVTAGAVEDAVALQVVTPTGPLWTTSADDYPIDLEVGGFKVTATACTATTGAGVQTFTIQPSPGTLVPGATVNLWQPPGAGL